MSIPAVIQYPTRSEPAVRGRLALVVPGRWATIERLTSGTEIVTNISMMIPPDRPPELPGLDGAGAGVTNNYFLERVADGVKIGMIRNGTVDPVGGFGFPGDVNISDEVPEGSWPWFAKTEYSGFLALFEDI